MRKYSFQIFLFLSIFIPSISLAANQYVRAGATGTGSGSDWINAYTSLPATLIRGDTYYIADGNYATYTVDDAVSGTSVITIKKATTTDHGTETGWDSSYGDGQAAFTSPFNIITSYVVFDGNVGSGSNSNSYGFSIATPANCYQVNRMLGIPPVGYPSLNITGITVAHTAIVNCGSAYDYTQIGIYSNPGTGTNITISNNYIKDSSANMLIRKWSNSTISDNYFGGNWSSAANHGEQISPGSYCNDIILKNNILKDSIVFVLGVHQPDNNRWKIYNNIVIGGTVTGVFANADSSS